MAGPSWDEAEHPRAPAGSPIGGQFVSSGGGASVGSSAGTGLFTGDPLAALHAFASEQGVHIHVKPDSKGTWIVWSFEAKETGKGAGTKVMQRLVDLADEHGKTIEMWAVAQDQTKQDRLVKFYKRFGFRKLDRKTDLLGRQQELLRRKPAAVVEDLKHPNFNTPHTDKLEESSHMIDVTDFPSEGAAGFLTPKGHVLEDTEGRSHEQMARSAGTSLDAVYEEGTARIYSQPGDYLGIEIHQRPTDKQMRTLAKLAAENRYKTFLVDAAVKSQRFDNWEEQVTPDDVRATINKAFTEAELDDKARAAAKKAVLLTAENLETSTTRLLPPPTTPTGEPQDKVEKAKEALRKAPYLVPIDKEDSKKPNWQTDEIEAEAKRMATPATPERIKQVKDKLTAVGFKVVDGKTLPGDLLLKLRSDGDEGTITEGVAIEAEEFANALETTKGTVLEDVKNNANKIEVVFVHEENDHIPMSTCTGLGRSIFIFNTHTDVEGKTLRNAQYSDKDAQTLAYPMRVAHDDVKAGMPLNDVVRKQSRLTAWHEYAHMADRASDRLLTKSMTNTLRDEMMPYEVDDWLFKNISGYSLSDPSRKEALADAVSKYMNEGKLPAPLDTWADHMLKKETPSAKAAA